MNKRDISTDHTLIISKIEKSIKFYNWNFVLSFLPKGAFLVGGYIRDIILGRLTEKVDIDIVVPSNSIGIGHQISKNFKGKLIILDKEREVIRIIFKQISIDIANQISPTIEGDLKSRDFSINSIAFLFDKNCLIDPLHGITDIKSSLLKTYSELNLKDDPLRILRCFRFISELNFKLDAKLISFIKKHNEKLNLVANERINYEIQRIIKGVNAPKSINLIRKFRIFHIQNSFKEDLLIDLENMNFEVLTEIEKKQFLPLFFLGQIFDAVFLEKLKFSKSDVTNTKLLQKWRFKLMQKCVTQLTEIERYKLHKELEEILPSFIFYLPQGLRLEWITRWRDKEDKLFHPSNLVNGDVIKKQLKINDGPLLGKLLNYLSMELAYDRLNNFNEAIYKAKLWIEQNAPKCD